MVVCVWWLLLSGLAKLVYVCECVGSFVWVIHEVKESVSRDVCVCGSEF